MSRWWTLPVVLFLAPFAWADPDDDLPAWHLKMDDPRPSKAARAKAADFLSQPDWGVLVSGNEGVRLGWAEVDESTNEGEGYFELPKGTKPTICMIDVDISDHDILTDSLDLSMEPGPRKLSFPDGSTVEITIDSFDVEAQSGADTRPEGARELTLGTPAHDSVTFSGQDRTDFWKLTLASPARVEGLILHPDGSIAATWRPGGPHSPAVDAMDGTAFSLDLPAGTHLLRIRALPWQPAGSSYTLLFCAVGADGKGGEALVQALLQPGACGADSRGREFSPADAVLDWLSSDAQKQAWLAGLAHADADSRALAAYAAGALQLPEAKTKLAEMASSDPDESVREAAIDALAKMGE